jgi:phage terminase large subunit
MPATFKGFSGPVGSGKSRALCHEVIKCAYLNPRVPGLLGGPTEKLLLSSTLIELRSILDQQGIPYEYRKSDNQLRLTEPDSIIFLVSLDNPERLRAMNLGWFGIDELSYCREDSWKRLEGRIRHPMARYRKGFAAWTPKGHDWVWKRFISARKIANHEAVQATPFENVVVTRAAPDYYSNLEHSYDEKFYRQEVLGEYLDMYSGSVYHAFSSENVRKCHFNPALPLIVSLDFNVNPMSGLIMQCEKYAGRETVNVLKEIVLPGSHVAAWCEQLVKETAPLAAAIKHALEIQVYGDPSGGSTHANSGASSWAVFANTMKKYEEYKPVYRYARKDPGVTARVNAVNGMLCSSADRNRKDRRLYIDPSCTELIADLEEVKWKVDAHGVTYDELDKRADPGRTHTSDALAYYVAEAHGLSFRGKATRETF